jgi:Ala-tRNA(Pro) deacylase
MEIFAFLQDHQISFERHDHPPVFTCEEADRLVPPLPGAKTKNIFLRDKKGTAHFLLIVNAAKQVDLRLLPAVLGSDKFSLASPERLRKYLGIEPGAVSLLAVINDVQGAVQVVIDRSLWDEPAFLCHPLTNTSTLVISRNDVEKFLKLTRHEPRIVDVPERD